MATRIERIVFDDLDASTDRVGTYRFALEDIEYEIDLSESNLQQLRTALEPFITAGRRLPRTNRTRGGGKPGSTAAEAKAARAAIRRWWAENQHTHHLPAWQANGRIPQGVSTAYTNAQ